MVQTDKADEKHCVECAHQSVLSDLHNVAQSPDTSHPRKGVTLAKGAHCLRESPRPS